MDGVDRNALRTLGLRPSRSILTVILHDSSVSMSAEWTDQYQTTGTNNILASLPSTAKILVYTSTGDLCLPRPKHWTLGFRNRTPAYKSIVFTDHDAPLRDDELSEGCYVRSKILAETAVLKADNGVNGLRTGSLRPGG